MITPVSALDRRCIYHDDFTNAVHHNDVETVRKIVSTLKRGNRPLLDEALWIAERGSDIRIVEYITDAIKRLS